MDCVRKACNQFSPFHLKNLKRDRKQAEEMIAKNKPSVFDCDGDDDDDRNENLGFSIVNSSRKRDPNDNIENKCNTITGNKKMTASKLDIPKDIGLNKSTIEKTESNCRKEMTNKRQETQCKSGHMKTPEKEDHCKLIDSTRNTKNTKTMHEDPQCPAKRRKLYENATGLLKEVEKTSKHIREETRTGDREVKRKEESENETLEKKLFKNSETPTWNSPEKTDSDEVTCCNKSHSDAATEGKENSICKVKDRSIANIESENENANKTTKEASDKKTEKAQVKYHTLNFISHRKRYNFKDNIFDYTHRQGILSNNLTIMLTFDFVLCSYQIDHGDQEFIWYLFLFLTESVIFGDANC